MKRRQFLTATALGAPALALVPKSRPGWRPSDHWTFEEFQTEIEQSLKGRLPFRGMKGYVRAFRLKEQPRLAIVFLDYRVPEAWPSYSLISPKGICHWTAHFTVGYDEEQASVQCFREAVRHTARALLPRLQPVGLFEGQEGLPAYHDDRPEPGDRGWRRRGAMLTE